MGLTETTLMELDSISMTIMDDMDKTLKNPSEVLSVPINPVIMEGKKEMGPIINVGNKEESSGTNETKIRKWKRVNA